MALNDVTFVKGQGGLGRPLDGEDHISGLVYYIPTAGTWPSGFSSTDRIKAVLSLEEAESLGIRGDYSLETVATGGNVEITATGVAGNTIEITINGLSLGTATVPASPTLATVAAALITAINAKTSVHGFTASGTGANVALTAPAGQGANINSGLDKTIVGTATVTLTQFSSGVNDPFIVIWYHISEYFRIQPKGVLYVGIFQAPSGTWTFEDVKTLQVTSGGVIRQVAVYTTTNFDITGSQISTLHGIADHLSTIEKQPLSILFASNFSNVSDSSGILELSELPDLSEGTSSYVSVVIGQDGNSTGNKLFTYTGKSTTCLGALLGAVSRSKVSENIGWVKNFNLSENELDVIKFADGTSYREVAESLLSVLNDRHYIFLRKHVGINGSYFNDSHTAVSEASDYATIENNRTIDKAIRNIRTFLIPELNGPLFVDPDTGNLSEDTSAFFQNLAGRPLEQMQRDQELSGFQVIVNPNQNVLSSSKLVIVVKLVPVGVARQIQVNIGFTVKIS
jgi:hypothetical protein